MKHRFSDIRAVLCLLQFLSVICCGFWCTAQTADSVDGSRCETSGFGSDSGLKVSMVTADPGREVYELEGHAALRLQREGVFDLVVNWGVFDFNSPNFIYRFVKGETDYMVAAYPFEFFLDDYRKQGRTVVEQVLNLTPRQAAEVEMLVRENLQPQNATYRYNYVKDNCSTRPLAIIEAALGDTLGFTEPLSFGYGDSGVVAHTGEPMTFRREMMRYHSRYPWYQFGIDLALGSGIDERITLRERAFSPLFLRELMVAAVTTDSVGRSKKITDQTVVLLDGIPGGVSEPSTPLLLTPLAVAIYLLVVVSFISWRDVRRKRLSRWFDTLLYGVFFFVGLLLTFLIFVSVHEATSPNWLYLWVNPFCLIVVIGMWLKSCKRVVYCYQICNFAALILLLSCSGLMGQMLNVAFYPLIACDLVRSITYIYVYRATRK